MRSVRLIAMGMAAAVVLGLPAVGVTAAAAQPSDPDSSAAAEADLRRQSPGKVTVRRDERGIVHFVGTERGKPARRPADVPANAAAARQAAAHLKRYAALWALDKRDAAVTATRTHDGRGGQSVVRFQQKIGDVPVLGGELAVTLDGAGNLQSVSGETTPLAMPDEALTVTAAKAQQTAVRLAARVHKVDSASLRASDAEAYAYDPALFGPAAKPGLSPVWRVEVTGPAHVRQLVLIDRARGNVALNVNQVAHADRVVCDRNNSRDTTTGGEPTLAACTTAGAARIEAGPPSLVTEVNAAFDHAGDTSDFFEQQVGVDLTALIGHSDADGKKLRSTVRYCLPQSEDPQCPMDNAFWNGNGVYLGAGYGQADDVVGHELTHGVIEKTANLAYWYQAGSINESMADVFGELVDLTNGRDAGTAQPWSMGEDAPGGAARSMSDPSAQGDPDRMTSSNYRGPSWIDDDFDWGGVHRNSGVGNKAAYLIAREPTAGPASFNGQTIIGIGYGKAAKVYYRALNMLTSGADYQDLHNVLPQACSDLAAVPEGGVVSADCTAVSQAVAATEMNLQPVADGAKAPEAPVGCTDSSKRDLFTDDFDRTTLGADWSRTSGMWPHVTGYAASGTHSLWGIEPDRQSGDPAVTTARVTKASRIPSGVSSYLHFDHQYLLAHWPGDDQDPAPEYWAGGRVEYSLDGTSWQNAMDLPFHSSGAVPKTITPYDSNGTPTASYRGFGGDSNGYVSSRIKLTSLAGKTVQFRWRVAGDPEYFLDGWTIDNVAVYACGGATPSEPRSVSGTGGTGTATVKWTAPLWPGTDGLTKYRITVSPGGKVIDNISPTATSQTVTGLSTGVSYTFTVNAYSAAGAGPAGSKKLIGTKVSSSVSASTITYGRSATIRGKFYREDSGTTRSGWGVTLLGRNKGYTSWRTLATATTASDGTVSFTHKPTRHYEYRLQSVGNSYYLGTRSSVRGVTVRQLVTGAFADSTVRRGATATFSGKVSPDHDGQTVYLQRYYSGKWNTISSKKLSSSSTYSFSTSRSSAGSYRYRVYRKGDTYHASGLSPTRTLTVS